MSDTMIFERRAAPGTIGTEQRIARMMELSSSDLMLAASAPVPQMQATTADPDITPPTVVMDAPAEGSTVSGVITLSAIATDDVAVQDVQFRLDSGNLGGRDASAPYSMTLDTTQFSNGTVALSAVATDTSGNQTASSPVTITVSNEPPPPPPPPRPPERSASLRTSRPSRRRSMPPEMATRLSSVPAPIRAAYSSPANPSH